MCGIVGFSGPQDTEKLNSMMTCIAHRGPDGESNLETENFSMGMRRLSIIDLVTPNIYPVYNEDQSVAVVFNGEIYNYKTLRQELRAKGHKFVTDSDSEVIVHGYEEWGAKMVERLRGMFTIGLFDKRKNRMFLFRDRLGIKPLYYTEYNGRLIFSSEIKGILAAWDIDRSSDETSVYRFLLTRIHDDTKRTFFKNIKRLMPAHYMEVDPDGNFRTHKYWQPGINTEFKGTLTDDQYAAETRSQFIESMRLHLITDVPLGVGLSGGLDSSGVVTAAAALLREGTDLHTDQKLLTFSAVHPGESIDESEYIDEVVEATGATSIKIIPEVEKFWEEYEMWMYYQEEPTISTAPYAYFTVMRKAREHVKVLLSGQGGDELFAGYVPYFMSYVYTARDANAFMDIMRESIAGFDIYKDFIVKKLKSKLDRTQTLNVREMVTADAELLKSDEFNHKHYKNLNERLRYDLQYGSVPNLLRYEDKNSMANSLESRVPFLDHVFVEYALSLPTEQKIKNGWNRYAYRNGMQGLIPEKNRLRRNKVGFVNSEWEWMQEKSTQILAIFNSARFRSRKYWNADKVISEFSASVNGERRGDWLMFWRILSVELWMRQFVDEFKRF